MAEMERDIEVADPPVGFTWGTSDGEYYLKSTDGELRRLSDDGWRLLRALVDGELSKGDLEGTAREVVEKLESEGYIRPNEPVVELRQPDPIRLWPRLLLFVGLVAIGLSVAWAEFPTMLTASELARPSRLAPFASLVVATIAIHEAGIIWRANRTSTRPFGSDS